MIFEGTKKSIFFGLGLTRAGHAIPNKLAQATLHELCKENNVPVYDT